MAKVHFRRIATIRGKAIIKADAVISTFYENGIRPLVQDNAVVAGNTKIIDGTIVGGKAYVGGVGTEIKGAYISDDARILGGTIHGAHICGQATISGNPTIIGD